MMISRDRVGVFYVSCPEAISSVFRADWGSIAFKSVLPMPLNRGIVLSSSSSGGIVL